MRDNQIEPGLADKPPIVRPFRIESVIGNPDKQISRIQRFRKRLREIAKSADALHSALELPRAFDDDRVPEARNSDLTPSVESRTDLRSRTGDGRA